MHPLSGFASSQGLLQASGCTRRGHRRFANRRRYPDKDLPAQQDFTRAESAGGWRHKRGARAPPRAASITRCCDDIHRTRLLTGAPFGSPFAYNTRCHDASCSRRRSLRRPLASRAARHEYISRKDEGDKLVVAERGDLVFVFNFHPVNSFSDYRVGCLEAGPYKARARLSETKFLCVLPSTLSTPSNYRLGCLKLGPAQLRACPS